MATPPFNLDTADPTDTSLGNAFPANERAFRDQVNSYLNTEHDINTGYHALQELTTSAKGALTSPPKGMIVYDTTLAQLQINTGTSSAPVWTNVISTAKPNAWLWQFQAPTVTTHTAATTDEGTLFSSVSAGGNLVVTLPNTANISVGWYAAFMQEAGHTIEAHVDGAHSEIIKYPSSASSPAVTTFNANFELFLLSFDGTNWEVLSATPNTWQAMGASNFYEASNPPPGTAYGFYSSAFAGAVTGTFTIPSTSLKVTLIGPGGGGGGADTTATGPGACGGFGGYIIAYLHNLTIGDTIAYAIAAAGTGGTTGAPGNAGTNAAGGSVISSGTQTITTRTASGGQGGEGGNHIAGSSVLGGPGGTTSGAATDILMPGVTGAGSELVSFAQFASPLMQYGGGGASGSYNGAGVAQPGDSGGNGLIIFEWIQ